MGNTFLVLLWVQQQLIQQVIANFLPHFKVKGITYPR
jgi:hypothetical protein